MSDVEVLNALLRTNFGSFVRRVFADVSPGVSYVHGKHIEAIGFQLMQVLTGKVTRLIINLPPRYMKSIIVSVAFSAWVLGRDPTRRIISVSYANELVTRLSMQTLSVMESEWYRAAFAAAQLAPHPKTQTEFRTIAGGYRYGVSVEGSLTGHGGNLILVDDPIKADDALSDVKRTRVNDWFRNSLLTRLDDKANDAVVIIMQRLHDDDLVGSLLESGDWTHLSLPAIAETDEQVPIGNGEYWTRKTGDVLHPERESLELLEGLRQEMGPTRFSGQYQQRPAPAGGFIVHLDWFERYEQPLLLTGGFVVQSWDTAYVAGEGNDWSVCTTWLWHEGRSYLLDLFRARLEFPAMRRMVVKLAAKWDADQVIIERSGAGISLIQDLNGKYPFRLRWHRPRLDKQTRLMAVSRFIEAGFVFLPLNAPWLEVFLDEVSRFPKGKHDDMVDSLSQYLFWVERASPRPRDGWADL